MKALTMHLREPLKSIKDQPFQFAVWWLVANVVGLAGIWLPLLILYVSKRPVYLTFKNIIGAGSLASFCVVILSEGIATNLIARKSQSSETAVGMRALLSIIALIIALIPVSIIIAQHVGEGSSQVSIPFQIILAVLSILFASYLYCFRFPVLGEEEVGNLRDKEDTSVRILAEEAEYQQADDKGVKL